MLAAQSISAIDQLTLFGLRGSHVEYVGDFSVVDVAAANHFCLVISFLTISFDLTTIFHGGDLTFLFKCLSLLINN